MQSKKSLEKVKNLVRRRRGPTSPSVRLLEPEVRSDLILPVTASGQVRLVGEAHTGKHKKQAHAGVFVVEWGFDVADEQVSNFHQWLAQNEPKLAANCPKGVAYKGTFVATFGPASRADGRYRTFWALDAIENSMYFGTDYGKGGGKDKSRSAFNKLLKEFVSFRDAAKATGFSQLYQIAAGTPQY